MTEFKDAKTMRMITQNAMSIKAAEELGPIMDEIRYAAKNAEYEITTDKKISNASIKFMTNLGYDVSKDGGKIKISWEK